MELGYLLLSNMMVLYWLSLWYVSESIAIEPKPINRAVYEAKRSVLIIVIIAAIGRGYQQWKLR